MGIAAIFCQECGLSLASADNRPILNLYLIPGLYIDTKICFLYGDRVMLKTALRSSLGSFIIGLHLAAVMAVLVGLQRWRQRGRDALQARMKTQPQIIIFWHEYLFVMSPLLPGGCSALQSPHPDGKVLAGASRLLGCALSGAAVTARQHRDCASWSPEVKSGRSVVITPDGPRGPARTLSMGQTRSVWPN